MLPSEVNDLQLIEGVKQNQNSDYLMELVNRHTGIYVNIINQYSYVPKVERDELIDHKIYNIYNYALNYDPSKKMKFSSWIGQNIKWQCQRLIYSNKGIMHVDEDELKFFIDERGNDEKNVLTSIKSELSKVKDKRFEKIFELRHLSKEKLTWSEIAEKINMSKQGARLIYIKNLKKIKDRIKKEIS